MFSCDTDDYDSALNIGLRFYWLKTFFMLLFEVKVFLENKNMLSCHYGPVHFTDYTDH